jgi:serine/threonine-protein kinase
VQLKSRLKPGCRVGPYETVRLLGVGYSGEVHEAVHAFTGQRVALKCLHSEHIESEHKVSRFSAEATTLFKLEHANVIRVVDAGWDDGAHPWMAMELLTGQTLGELLARQGRLSPSLALQYALDIAWGIDAAHENRVIHRDLKPDNVFIVARSGAIKVLDFSAAKFLTSDLRTTKPPDMTCTLAYAAPELLEGQQADARIDIYALGLILWQMIAGEHPYENVLGKQHALITAHFERVPAALVLITKQPALAFLDVLLRPALAKTLAARYPTMAHFAQAIMKAQAHLAAEIAAGNLVIEVPPGEPALPRDPDERKVYQAPESAPREDTAPAPPVSRVTLASRAVGPLGTLPLPVALVEAAVLAARAPMPSRSRTPEPMEAEARFLVSSAPAANDGESHRPTLPRRAAAPRTVAPPSRASVPMLGLMALAAILAIGNMAWWLQRSRGPELAATLAEAPTAPPQTPLTPDLPEPVVLAPDPTVAPMLSASMAPLDKTELPVTRPPTDAPRPKARVPVKPRAVPPKPPPSGEPVLFDFPK